MKDVDGVTLPEPEAVVDGVGPLDCDPVNDAAADDEIVASCVGVIVAEVHAVALTKEVLVAEPIGDKEKDRDAVNDPDRVDSRVGRVTDADCDLDASAVLEESRDAEALADAAEEGDEFDEGDIVVAGVNVLGKVADTRAEGDGCEEGDAVPPAEFDADARPLDECVDRRVPTTVGSLDCVDI